VFEQISVQDDAALFRAVNAVIDDGFCLCEIILDADGRPEDYRFLSVNNRFSEMTGLSQADGRTALDLVPQLERHWIDTYGRVALDRTPVRFQSASDALGRVFDVYAAPADPPGRFTIVFRDVTAHLRSERER
jgi:PAS domain S-box-containing protein